MIYPEGFEERIKSAFSDRDGLYKALGHRTPYVGICLNAQRNLTMDPARIVAFLEQGTTQPILDDARAAAVRTALFHEWSQLYIEQDEE